MPESAEKNQPPSLFALFLVVASTVTAVASVANRWTQFNTLSVTAVASVANRWKQFNTLSVPRAQFYPFLLRKTIL
jgi:hypothetical protein